MAVKTTVLIGLLAMAVIPGMATASPGESSIVYTQAGTLLRLRGGEGFLSALSERWAGLRQPSKAPPPDPAVSTSSSLNAAGPKIIISGAPASGKGTQCEFIVNKFGVVHISTGENLDDDVF
jgi:hypothetical protein